MELKYKAQSGACVVPRVVSIGPSNNHDQTPPQSELCPAVDACSMDIAPIEAGVEFGPCLIYTDSTEGALTNWRRGMWDGENWYILGAGFIVSPIAWFPLPRDPTWR